MKYEYIFKMCFDATVIMEADSKEQAEQNFYDTDVRSFVEMIELVEEDVNTSNIKDLEINDL